MRVTHLGNVISVYLDISKPDWNRPIFLTSDWHWDSTLCRRDVLYRHLDRAVKLNAWVGISGDANDLMQGKFDKRRDYKDLREEYKGTDYIDRVEKDMVKQLKPYAKNILWWALGNHETGLLRNNSTNFVDRVTRSLNVESKSSIEAAGYAGWVRFMLDWKGKPHGSFLLHYHHGYGGTNAPVTRGVIQTNRQAVIWPDAAIVHNGHNHQDYTVPIPRERLSNKGIPFQDLQWHIRTPGYKSALEQAYGFDVEKFPEPTPMGSTLVSFDYVNDKIVIEPTAWIE